MSRFFEIRWHGRGGQGTVTAAKSLAEAVQGTGKYAMAFPEYGPERRGAPIRAFNKFHHQKIRVHAPVQNPDVVIIVDPTLVGNPDLVAGIKENTIFIVNTELSALKMKEKLGLMTQKLYTVPANDISYALFHREIPNSAMIGAFARACPDIISLPKIIEESRIAFKEMLGESLVEKNIEAIRKGFQEGDYCE
jgi:pyruvate ferredoxin oxidoreductase gamma subunit